jgi:hypothetical protein
VVGAWLDCGHGVDGSLQSRRQRPGRGGGSAEAQRPRVGVAAAPGPRSSKLKASKSDLRRPRVAAVLKRND